MLSVTVGTAPVNWNNRDVPDYRPHTPYERMLDEMAEAGYEGTEYGEEFPTDPRRVRADLDRRGLRLASMFCAMNLRDDTIAPAEIERAEVIARLLATLGGDVLIAADSGDERRRTVAGRADGSVVLDEEGWRSMVSGLEELARRCSEHGVRLAFHNHVGTYVETEEELARLLDSTDPDRVGLCLDVGHMCYAGGDVLRITERYGPRITYVHLKDVDERVLERCRREGLGFHDALRLGIFPELGTGAVDFARFLDSLSGLDYTGWLIVEQDTTMRTPLESARLNREYLRREFGL